MRGFADGFAFQTKLVDVADENDGCLDGNAEKRKQPQSAGNAERRMRKLERDKGANRLGKRHLQRDGKWKFEIVVEREKNHEDEQDRQRPDDVELGLGREQFVILAAPLHV